MSSKLQRLKKQHKIATIGMGIVAAIVIFLLLYYAGNGFSLNDSILFSNDDCRVMIDEPLENQEFHRTDEIRVTGSVWGGIPKKVIVWEQKHNVPIYATISGTSFGVSFTGADLSDGEHVICIQAQTNDGRWTPVVTRLILVNNYQPDSGSNNWFGFPLSNNQQTWSETYLPEPVATVFRPVEEVLAQTVVYVTGGTASDDLNGDNIPDEIQQSPAAPRYNPVGAPVTLFFVYAVIAGIILAVIFFLIKPYLERKQEAQKQLQQDSGWRQWKLQLQSLNNQKLKAELKAEKLKRQKLEKDIKEKNKKYIEAAKKRPVIVNVQNKKGEKTPAKQQPQPLTKKLKDKAVVGIRRIPKSQYYQKVRNKVRRK
jgi:hypothetical protein